MTSEADWVEVGRRLAKAREAKGISARSAAKLAPMSPTYWQDLERGARLDGGRFNPSSSKLEAAARVVGLDPAPLFAMVGRPYQAKPAPPAPDRIEALEQRLNDLEAKVDLLLAR